MPPMCFRLRGIYPALIVGTSSDKWMFPKIGGFYPPKWMVKIMDPNPMNKWMIWGYHYFWKHPFVDEGTGESMSILRQPLVWSKHPGRKTVGNIPSLHLPFCGSNSNIISMLILLQIFSPTNIFSNPTGCTV